MMTRTRAGMLNAAHEAMPILDELDDVVRRLAALRWAECEEDVKTSPVHDLLAGSRRMRVNMLATIGDAQMRPDLYAEESLDLPPMPEPPTASTCTCAIRPQFGSPTGGKGVTGWSCDIHGPMQYRVED